MTRTEMREVAFELLYSFEIQKIVPEEKLEQIELLIQEKQIHEKEAKAYLKETIQGISENEPKITEMITKNLSPKWEIGRISKINISLLKLATFEMVYSKLPYKVVINEVVELAKKYGDDNSPSFINGILANIVKQVGLKEEE